MDYEDDELKAMVADLQLLQAKYIDEAKVENLINDLSVKIAHSKVT